MYYVYILNKNIENPYIGCTNEFDELLQKSPTPGYFAFSNHETALAFQTYLQSSSGRAFVKKHGFLDLYLLANSLEHACHRYDKLRKYK